MELDAIVIGAGQAGPPLAERLTAAGMRVALVERHLFGGTCVNTGCMPTKTLVASARAAHVARRAADYGVLIDGGIAIDMRRVQARAAHVANHARGNVEKWLAGMPNLRVLQGHARFVAPDAVQVGEETLRAPRVFVNVGARPDVPDLPGLRDVPFLTSTGMLRLDRVPRHLVILGGSYIALEFAQMFRRFGAAVTVVQRGPRLLSREDEGVAQAVREVLEGEGVAVRTGADTLSFAPHPDGVAVRIGDDAPIVGSHLLVALGRRPNTDDLGLERAGVATDKRGFIEVDGQLRTNVPGIWALGDCNGRGAFTHTSYNDHEIVAANLLDGAQRSVDDRVPGYAVYVDPPLARAGMSEAEARKTGRALLTATRPMTRVGRAVERDETAGFIKLVADAQTRRILGATIFGIEADEAIHGVLDMMNADEPIETLQWAVPIHPTVSELLPTVVGSLRPAN